MHRHGRGQKSTRSLINGPIFGYAMLRVGENPRARRTCDVLSSVMVVVERDYSDLGGEVREVRRGFGGVRVK